MTSEKKVSTAILEEWRLSWHSKRCLSFVSKDKKETPTLGFCRVAKVITSQGEQSDFFSTDQRTKWLSAIRTGNLTENAMELTVFVVFIFTPVKPLIILLRKSKKSDPIHASADALVDIPSTRRPTHYRRVGRKSTNASADASIGSHSSLLPTFRMDF